MAPFAPGQGSDGGVHWAASAATRALVPVRNHHRPGCGMSRMEPPQPSRVRCSSSVAANRSAEHNPGVGEALTRGTRMSARNSPAAKHGRGGSGRTPPRGKVSRPTRAPPTRATPTGATMCAPAVPSGRRARCWAYSAASGPIDAVIGTGGSDGPTRSFDTTFFARGLRVQAMAPGPARARKKLGACEGSASGE